MVSKWFPPKPRRAPKKPVGQPFFCYMPSLGGLSIDGCFGDGLNAQMPIQSLIADKI
jgi:hypothetical protein